MQENVIISLADSNYFDLLNELIDSIKRFEESYGSIKDYENPNIQLNFGPTAKA